MNTAKALMIVAASTFFTATSAHGADGPGGATPVDAPPAMLLFAMAAGGLLLGRKMARRRREDD
ncbi:MAG: hypothetical protein HKN78_13375 [Sphingomonadaceae bacterium]|nr:hypothetical protein [Sphingomonadaceae bacterium]